MTFHRIHAVVDLFVEILVLTWSLRVRVPNNWVLRIWVIVFLVQLWGRYMIIEYLDPSKVQGLAFYPNPKTV